MATIAAIIIGTPFATMESLDEYSTLTQEIWFDILPLWEK